MYTWHVMYIITPAVGLSVKALFTRFFENLNLPKCIVNAMGLGDIIQILAAHEGNGGKL